jgi:hypothetical protein
MPAPEKRLPFAGLRGMAGAGMDRRRRSLNKAGRRGARRHAGCRRGGEVRGGTPAAGGVDGGSAGGGVAGGGEEGRLLSPNLWLSRLSPRGTPILRP